MAAGIENNRGIGWVLASEFGIPLRWALEHAPLKHPNNEHARVKLGQNLGIRWPGRLPTN
eukprot:8423405-Lingulodinium_polyedra.AAC.1